METGTESVSATINKHSQITLKCFKLLFKQMSKISTDITPLFKKAVYSSIEIVQKYFMIIMFSYIMTMADITKSNAESSFCFQKVFHSIFYVNTLWQD